MPPRTGRQILRWSDSDWPSREDYCWTWSPPTTMPVSMRPRRLSSIFWQHRDERVDQFLGVGVPLVQVHVSAQVQTGDAVGAGQNESAIAPGVLRTGDATHDLEKKI